MQPIVTIQNGQAVTTSLLIAEAFGKRHSNILRAIANLNLPDEFRRLNFASTFRLVDGPNGTQRKEPMAVVTRDGFVFLCMGFTGPDATLWKVGYINAFNRMEAKLRAPIQDDGTAIILDLRKRLLEAEFKAAAIPKPPQSPSELRARAKRLTDAADKIEAILADIGTAA